MFRCNATVDEDAEKAPVKVEEDGTEVESEGSVIIEAVPTESDYGTQCATVVADLGDSSTCGAAVICLLPLGFNQYKEIICRAREDRSLVCECAPLITPEGGTIVVYDCATVPGWKDLSAAERRRCCRVDGYRWSHMKSSKALSNGLSRCYNFIYDPESKKGSNLFVRNEYCLRDDPGGIVLFHYIGDHDRARQISQRFLRFSRKSSRARSSCTTQSEAIVNEESALGDLALAASTSTDLLLSAAGGSLSEGYSNGVPAELEYRTSEFPARRWPKLMMLNLYELFRTLKYANGVHFVGDYVVTRLWVPGFFRPMLDELSAVISVAGVHALELMYHTAVFANRVHVSSLCFRHPLFSTAASLQSPVLPLAILVHERNTVEEHQQFLRSVMKMCDNVQNGRYCIVSDGDFPLDTVWPNSTLVHCWSHIVRTVRGVLQVFLAGRTEELCGVMDDLEQIMRSRNEHEFDAEWVRRKVTSSRYLNVGVLRCMEAALCRVRKHASVWVLREAGVACPEVGVTASACDGLNRILHDLELGGAVAADLALCAFYYLGNYYQRELLKGYHQLGQFQLKPAFADRLQRRMPLKDLPFCPAVECLIDYVKESGILEMDHAVTEPPTSDLHTGNADIACKRSRLNAEL